MHAARITPPATATRRPHPKLDLRLTTLVELGPEAYGVEQPTLEACAPPGLRRDGPLAFLRGAFPDNDGLESGSSGPSVQVFLTATSEAALSGVLFRWSGQGLTLSSRAGAIATAEVALGQIHHLEADPEVVALEWTGAFRPAGEPGAGSGAQAPRSAMGLDGAPPELDGRGVLVGIVDVGGLDFYHPDFVDARGRTRVRALWDQRASPAAEAPGAAGHRPGAPRYGRVHERGAVDGELAPDQLERYSLVDHRALKGSHGTTSAALALGLGGGSPAARGIAPGAELVFVDTYGSGPGALGAMTELADALAFVFALAAAEQKPCVVNVSLGDDLGPRDGTSPVERFIDALLDEPGRAIVVAAGNSCGRNRHTRVQVVPAQETVLEIDVGEGNHDRAVIELWYERDPLTDAALEVEIEAPGGNGRSPRLRPDGLPRAFDVIKTRVLAASTRRVPVGNNGLVRIELLARGEGEALLPGIWKLHLHAHGAAFEAHAWIDHRHIRFAAAVESDDATTLTTPGTAQRAIVVGAYDLQNEKVFCFSGRGPGRRNVKKPDMVAPGGPLFVASAMTTVRYVDSAFGTSLAAPLVTGAIALLFQSQGKDLRWDEIAQKLLPRGPRKHDPQRGHGVARVPIP